MGGAIAQGLCNHYKVAYNENKSNSTAGATTSNGGNTVKVELKVLKKGASGNQVKALQRMLHGLGYSLGSKPIDGDFGGLTDTAVRNYHKNNGLTVDGIVGQATWNKLLGVN